MHAGDAKAHQGATCDETQRCQFCLPDDIQHGIGEQHGDQKRVAGSRQIVTERDGQREGEHPDEMH